MKSIAVLTLLVMLSACGSATSGHVQTEFCRVAKPIYLDPADRLTDRTERGIISHNETGAALCRWGAPRAATLPVLSRVS